MVKMAKKQGGQSQGFQFTDKTVQSKSCLPLGWENSLYSYSILYFFCLHLAPAFSWV